MASYVPMILVGVFGAVTLVLALRILPPQWRKRVLDALAVAGVVAIIGYNSGKRAPAVKPSEFAQAVDLEPIKSLAVQHNGRVKSFDSLARAAMRMVSGTHPIAGQESAFTYLDMMLRPDAYTEADVLFVKEKQIRAFIADHLVRMNTLDLSVIDTFRKTGLISPSVIDSPIIEDLLGNLEQDLMRTAKGVGGIRNARFMAQASTLSQQLRIIPPPGGDASARWYLGDDVWGGEAPDDDVHAGMRARKGVPGLDAALAGQMRSVWSELATAWSGQDAPRVNDKLQRLAALVRTVEPAIYPQLDKLRLENWYFRWKSMTWIWIVYLAAVVPLLMAAIYRWNRARWLGMSLFFLAFGLHSGSLALRWYLSGRIPNSNMYEAITAATWLAGIVAMALEFAARKTAMRGLFVLGAGSAAMVATMCNHFLPATLSSDIDNIMPVLHDVWLYIHTNMIILSYGLIAMAAVSALLYLRHRLGGGTPDVAALGGAGSLIIGGKGRHGFLASDRVTAAAVYDGATMIMMELSFVTLWTGLVMGAIWADHSWGRPWGWDPKEVFALNTFIVFLLLVHVRYKVKDKGLWTAVLATVGCGVMLFNWIVINFVITGLHSYA